MSDLLVLNLERRQAGLQLLTPLEQLDFQRLLCTHHSHLHPPQNRAQWKMRHFTI